METKNQSIEKLLKSFNVKPTEMKVSIIGAIIWNANVNGVYGMPKVALSNQVFKNLNVYSRAKFNGALNSLNNHEVVKWEVTKGIARVNLTVTAWALYLGGDIKEGVKELVEEVGKNLDGCYHVIAKESGKLKKKTLKKVAKLLEEVADKIRNKTQK